MTEIEAARLKTGMKRSELSRLLEIPYRTLEDWEKEKRNPPEWAKKLLLEKLENMALEKS